MSSKIRVLLSACVALSAFSQLASTEVHASSQIRDFRDFDVRESYMSDVCILNRTTGEGLTATKLWPIFATVLVERFPDRLAFVEEEQCGDSIDNDCDGKVNEDCDAEPASNWLAGPACEACMEENCSAQGDTCMADVGCVKAVTCVGENNCMDRSSGSLSCLCGQGVSATECIKLNSEELTGDCVEELLPPTWKRPPGTTIPFIFNPGPTSQIKASRALYCMTSKCRDACADNYYNHTVPVCGNGVVESGEFCDDGNTVDGDGCSSECRSGGGGCGDGIVQAGEACDDGNTVSNDGCSDACKIEPSCGNGIVEEGEACDDGNQISGDGCEADCTFVSHCGNGILEPGYVEECDDGNRLNGDGCDENCNREPACGDGIVQGAEACDDGNQVPGDGCEPDCSRTGICGDGIIHPALGEECDDGNQEPGDGCDERCSTEPGPLCGNGIVQEGEECDDGNDVDGDGCSPECTLSIPPSPWNAGRACDTCMERECASESNACLMEDDCRVAIRCPVTEKCISPSLGAITCICGVGASISECQAAWQSNTLGGPCAESLYVPVPGSTVPFGQFGMMDTPLGKANRAFACMARKCRTDCSDNLKG